MKMTKELIKQLADDIMLEITDKEIEEILLAEKNIVSMFEEVQKINTNGIEEMNFPFEVENSFLREDEDYSILNQNIVLENAPKKDENYILINKVVE